MPVARVLGEDRAREAFSGVHAVTESALVGAESASEILTHRAVPLQDWAPPVLVSQAEWQDASTPFRVPGVWTKHVGLRQLEPVRRFFYY